MKLSYVGYYCVFLALLSMSGGANENTTHYPNDIQEKAAYIEDLKFLQILVEKQEKDISSLRNMLVYNSNSTSSNEVNEFREELKSIKNEKAYFSYADMAAISLTAVSILITILGIVVAILSFWGFKNIQKTVQIQAAEVANAHAVKTVPLELSNVASKELKKIIESGLLNAQLQDAVDMILRREQPPEKSKVSQLLSELDEGERDE
ncbi:hypothetical protein [Aeromonas veronii]|uniref:hypothetical protein n=1 Tax=Aeromonas veronii TaxID=654 RepID=UPI003BA1D7F6